MNWTDREKEDILQWIDEHYFGKSQFGSTAKTDIETFLFSMYLEHRKSQGENCDDYLIGQQLHITNQKVRSLKERKQLLFPSEDYSWQHLFAEYVKFAKYDENAHLVKMMIPDVNVIKDVRYYLETHGWFDEYQLNPKLFQCRLDVFLEFTVSLNSSEGEKKLFGKEAQAAIRKIDMSEDNRPKIEAFFRNTGKDAFKNLALTVSKDTLALVLGALPFGGTAKLIIDYLIQVINPRRA